MTTARSQPATSDDLPGDLWVTLPAVMFPEVLWQSLRARVLEQPQTWPELSNDGRWLADRLWPHWGASLEALGVTAQDLAHVVVGYRRELWLWLMGERTWAHTVACLAGRTLRRAPSIGMPSPALQERK